MNHEAATPQSLNGSVRTAAALVAIDGDADLADGGDGEPSLASPAGGDSQIIWCAGSDDDQEQAVRSVSFG